MMAMTVGRSSSSLFRLRKVLDMPDKIKKMFGTATKIQWWVVFSLATVALFLEFISGGSWTAIVGGSKLLEEATRGKKND